MLALAPHGSRRGQPGMLRRTVQRVPVLYDLDTSCSKITAITPVALRSVFFHEEVQDDAIMLFRPLPLRPVAGVPHEVVASAEDGGGDTPAASVPPVG
jgi:hypothetical protein